MHKNFWVRFTATVAIVCINEYLRQRAIKRMQERYAEMRASLAVHKF